jgi:hypothetical protein
MSPIRILFLSLRFVLAALFALTDVTKGRELFLVDPMASNGTNTSLAFQAQGYTIDHRSTCTISLFGIPENTAAGDHDMLMASRLFKDRFNEAMKKIDPEMSVIITSVVIQSQTLGTTVDRRQLSRATVDRGLSEPLKYSNSPAVIKWLCRKCKSDSKDARRALQDAMIESDFVNALANDLKDGESIYIANALEVSDCLKVSCDDGEALETENCATLLL